MRALALLVVLAACGGGQRDAGPPQPSGPDAAPPLDFDAEAARELAAGLLDYLTTMAAIVEQRANECVAEVGKCSAEIADDCPCVPGCAAMAVDLASLFDTVAPLFELEARVAEDPDAARLATAALKAHDEAVGPIADRISEHLAACAGDAAVIEVMQRMPVLP